MDRKEIINQLEDGAYADIWYDAADYGDEGPEEVIERTKQAMMEAAELLSKKPSGEIVVLNIYNRQGSLLYACESVDMVDDILFEYVRNKWADLLEYYDERPMPSVKQAAIDVYFDRLYGVESYVIEKLTIMNKP